MAQKFVIPGFGPNAVAPTQANVAGLYEALVVERAVKLYADREHWTSQSGQVFPVDDESKFRVKSWHYPFAPSYSYWTPARNLDGSYRAAKISRITIEGSIERNWHSLFSLHAFNWWDERATAYPNLLCPLFEQRTNHRANFVSWPDVEVEDPVEFPLAGFSPNHVCILEDGVPYVYTIPEASKAYPVKNVIVAPGNPAQSGGLDPAKVAVLVDKLLTSAGRASIAPQWVGSTDKISTLKALLG